MLKHCWIIVPVVMFVLSGCATTGTSSIPVDGAKPALTLSQEQCWKLMVGRWYGDQPLKDGGRKQWIVTRAADGTYRIDFVQTASDGKVEKSAEAGQWAVSGLVYFSSFRGWIDGVAFRPANPSDPYNYDAYRIIRLDDEIFEYEHFATGNHFSVKRVGSGFEIPQ